MSNASMLKSFPIPEREQERIHALHKTQLLDSVPELSFDDIAQKAKEIFNVPIVLISLVDSDRQWFKSKCGLQASQTSRDIAFCSYTILSEEVMVIPDALQDDRFKLNPLVVGDPNIRFYAAAPIIVPDGLILGTLCIIDTTKRDDFSKDNEAMLKSLANQISQLIQKRVGL